MAAFSFKYFATDICEWKTKLFTRKWVKIVNGTQLQTWPQCSE